MSKMFVRCMGKAACQETETHCRTCGRTIEEIYATRDLVDELVNFALRMNYENSDSFFNYLASKAEKKIAHLKQQASIEATG